MTRRYIKKPGNAKQRKAINKQATDGDIRGALAILQLLDPGASRMYIRPSTRDNMVR